MNPFRNLKLKLSTVVISAAAVLMTAAPLLPASAQAATTQTTTVTITQDQVNSAIAGLTLKSISNLTVTFGDNAITASYSRTDKKGKTRQISEVYGVSATFPQPVIRHTDLFSVQSVTIDGAAPKRIRNQSTGHNTRLGHLIRQQVVQQLKSVGAKAKDATITGITIQTGSLVISLQYTPKGVSSPSGTPVATQAATPSLGS